MRVMHRQRRTLVTLNRQALLPKWSTIALAHLGALARLGIGCAAEPQHIGDVAWASNKDPELIGCTGDDCAPDSRAILCKPGKAQTVTPTFGRRSE